MPRRSLYPLLALFFAGLLALWWADRARIPTDQERRRLSGRVLPGLSEVDPRTIDRLEISGGPEPLEFRRDSDGRWRMVAPFSVRASQPAVESLVSALRSLRRLPDAKGLSGDPAKYGLETPPRTIRAYGPSSPKAL